ncbi:helix-turn-helix domain-containing protein [Oceanobacillus manasiensis]|uniref:hypothetical protein n=1 Tax=Oceanobacillus manasiensis TaxID=586413 RepID=UPI00069340A4|nr:hypothetical protein [Oceanobacillus manasiensis]
MTTYLIANETTYRNLSTFTSVEAMDAEIKQHKDAHNLTQTERDVLDVLARHSCKYKGVSFLTNSKLGMIVGIRRETASRVRSKLERKGIIRQYRLKRDGGDRRETGSAAVIQPAVTAEVTPNVSHHKATPNKLNKNSNTHKRDGDKQANPQPNADELGKRALKTGIPSAIYDALAPYFDVKALYDVYGILIRAKASVDRSITFEEHGQAYIDEFHNIIRKLKLGQVRNFNGLLYVAWRKVTEQVSRLVGSARSPLYYDWLAE